LDQEQEWKLWRTWLGEEPKNPSISEDVVSMYATRAIWWGFNAIYGKAPEEARKNATFQQWIASNYFRSQALGIRRQTDLRTDVISLAALIKRVAEAPQVLSRERFSDAHGLDEYADQDFDDVIGVAGLNHIDSATPLDDLKRLRDGTESVRTWVTKEVAHCDPNKGTFEVDLTFGDLALGCRSCRGAIPEVQLAHPGRTPRPRQTCHVCMAGHLPGGVDTRRRIDAGCDEASR
jgi:hypothetical protein